MCWDRLIEAETASSKQEPIIQEQTADHSEVDRVLAGLYESELEEVEVS